jgi:transposase
MSMTTFKTQIYLTYENEDLVKQLFGLRRLFFNYAIDRIYSTDGAKNTMGLLSEVYADIASQKARPAILNVNMRYGNSQHFLKEVFEDAVEAVKLAKKNSKKQNKDIRVEYQSKKDRKETFSMYGKGPRTISQEGPHTISVIFNKDIGRIFVRTRESVDFISKRTDKIRTITITRKGGKYWLSLTFERTNRVLEKTAAGTVVGIDLGVKISSVQFDGKETTITNFNTKGSLRSERLANKVDLSRKKQGSKRYEKAVLMK